jgi:hypothetical protein
MRINKEKGRTIGPYFILTMWWGSLCVLKKLTTSWRRPPNGRDFRQKLKNNLPTNSFGRHR